MAHPIFGQLGKLGPRRSSKLHFYETRMGLRAVLFRLDTRRKGVITSLELKDEGGVAILLVIERMKRECCTFVQHFCGCHRSSISEMPRRLLWRFRRADPKPDMKKPNLKRQGFVLGGGRALEPCKSL